MRMAVQNIFLINKWQVKGNFITQNNTNAGNKK